MACTVSRSPKTTISLASAYRRYNIIKYLDSCELWACVLIGMVIFTYLYVFDKRFITCQLLYGNGAHTLKLTAHKGNIWPHQQNIDKHMPAMCLFQHHNGFTFSRIYWAAVISLVFISLQHEYESLFCDPPTTQFKLKICSLSKELSCRWYELCPWLLNHSQIPYP